MNHRQMEINENQHKIHQSSDAREMQLPPVLTPLPENTPRLLVLCQGSMFNKRVRWEVVVVTAFYPEVTFGKHFLEIIG